MGANLMLSKGVGGPLRGLVPLMDAVVALVPLMDVLGRGALIVLLLLNATPRGRATKEKTRLTIAKLAR